MAEDKKDEKQVVETVAPGVRAEPAKVAPQKPSEMTVEEKLDKPAVAGGANATRDELKKHPVEKAKADARDEAEKFLDETEGDKSNLTATQKRAIEDQRREMAFEEKATPEPARSVNQSVGTERKYGIRTAQEEPERKKANKEVEKANEAQAEKDQKAVEKK